MNKRPQHRRQTGEDDGFGAHGAGADHGLFEIHTARDLLVDEIHQENGIAHDDAGERDHADHRGRGELRPQQRMPGHHTDHGQRDRRHDDQRHEIGTELRDHQQINQ